MIQRALVALTLCTAPALAQDKVLEGAFRRFDRNKDGFIEKAEFPGNAEVFAAMDGNKDAKVDFGEFKESAIARNILAASKAAGQEPRPRVDPSTLADRRLALLARYDANRDGRVTKAEWVGPPQAFDSLDLTGDGVLDKRDRARADAAAAARARKQVTLPEVRARLPGADSALKAYDENKDAQISRKEAGRSPFAKLFPYADKNGDQLLDRRELNDLIARVNATVDQRNRGYARRRAPEIPFKAWDKNDDGRLDLKEWVDRKYLFKQADINRDAAVTRTELLRFKRAYEGDDFLEKFDLDEDGRVTREEFGGSRAAFDRADRNGDGVISRRDR